MERGQADAARFLFKSVVTQVKPGGLGRQKEKTKPPETIKTIKMASTLYKIGKTNSSTSSSGVQSLHLSE